VDYGDVVVHIFFIEVREYYALERLWADAKRVNVPRSRAIHTGSDQTEH
jgi:ribosome-associated protein